MINALIAIDVSSLIESMKELTDWVSTDCICLEISKAESWNWLLVSHGLDNILSLNWTSSHVSILFPVMVLSGGEIGNEESFLALERDDDDA